MSEFHILCSSLVKISVLSGFFRFQNLSGSSKDYTSFFFIYFVLASMTGVWAIASNIHFVLTIDMFNARTIGVASAYSLSLFGSVYLMAHSKQIHLLMTDFRSLIKILTEYDIFNKGSESVIFHRAAKLDKILKFFLISYVSLPAGTTFFIYVSHLKFGTIDMLYPVAYDVHNRPFLYEVTLFFQCTAAFVASGRLVSSIGFLFTMLFHLNLCLKQLRFSSKNVFQNKDNTDEQVFQHHSKLNQIQFGQYLHTGLYNYNKNRLATDNRYHNSVFDERYINSTERFREWVKIHKFILRLTKDLNSVYSPVLGSFLFTSFGIGIFIIFSCTMEDTALADKMGFLGFWFLFMGILLALCYCGTLLTHENSILLQDVQDVISVCGNSEIQKCALITGERIKKPLRISVFGSHYFDLSVDTFLWMVKSMASLYISIAQFKKINEM